MEIFRFHRIQRKKRELQASKQEGDEDLLEKADRLRAEVRLVQYTIALSLSVFSPYVMYDLLFSLVI